MMMSQSYQLIKDLYECDTVSGECRICPKLRRVHIQPTSFQRMNVKIATQVIQLLDFLYM